MSQAIPILVICSAGAVANTWMISVVLCHRQQLTTVPNLYVMNLAVVDTLACLVTYPFIATEAWGWLTIPGAVCSGLGGLLLGHRIASVAATALIAINRCIKVTQPRHRYQALYTPLRVCGSLVIMWLLVGLLLVPLLTAGHLGHNNDDRNNDDCNNTTTTHPNYCAYDVNQTHAFLYVNVGLHACFVLPCTLVTLCCYAYIGRTLRRSYLSVAPSAFLHQPSTPSIVAAVSATAAAVSATAAAVVQPEELSQSGLPEDDVVGAGVVNMESPHHRARISIISAPVPNPNMLHPRLSTSSVQIATGPKFLAAVNSIAPIPENDEPNPTVSSPSASVSGSFRQLNPKSRMVLVCLFAVCVCMLLTWSPVLVTSMLASRVSPFAHQMALCMACLSTVSNPLLYGVYNRNIRKYAMCRKQPNVVA